MQASVFPCRAGGLMIFCYDYDCVRDLFDLSSPIISRLMPDFLLDYDLITVDYSTSKLYYTCGIVIVDFIFTLIIFRKILIANHQKINDFVM